MSYADDILCAKGVYQQVYDKGYIVLLVVAGEDHGQIPHNIAHCVKSSGHITLAAVLQSTSRGWWRKRVEACARMEECEHHCT